MSAIGSNEMSKKLADDKVYIFFHETEVDDFIYDRVFSWLPEDRKNSALKKKSRETRNQSVLSFGLLAKALEYLGIIEKAEAMQDCSLVRGEHGKPYLENYKDIFFSLSHTGGRVMCAVSKKEVGCDIEKRSKDIDTAKRIADRFYTSEEQKNMHSLYDFYRIWTMKESFAKYSGAGMTQPFDSFSVYDCKPTAFVVLEDDKYTASVCSDNSDIEVIELAL